MPPLSWRWHMRQLTFVIQYPWCRHIQIHHLLCHLRYWWQKCLESKPNTHSVQKD
jgi:hypothetical protein